MEADSEDDPLGREIGERLWTSYYDQKEIDNHQVHDFEILYTKKVNGSVKMFNKNEINFSNPTKIMFKGREKGALSKFRI